MENKSIYEALSSYFNTVSKVGYMSYKEVNKVLLSIYLNKILNNSYYNYITEDELKTINNTLNCIKGTSCLIPL